MCGLKQLTGFGQRDRKAPYHQAGTGSRASLNEQTTKPRNDGNATKFCADLDRDRFFAR